MNTKTKTISTFKICAVAIAIVINLVGGQLALLLKLPIYLDCIGTLFIAATLGPVYAMLPNTISGLIMGLTVDIYSLYFAPVGIILGFVAGIVFKKYNPKKWWLLVAALVITLPSTLVSSSISAFLFGGITSSSSSIIIQLLSKTPLGLVGSCFVVQFFTDYLDRVIALYLAAIMIKALPNNLMEKFR